MRFRSTAGTIGVALLAMLILFLSTGIDDLENHIPFRGSLQALGQQFLSPLSAPNSPEPDHCNACFFNQLLSQCLFPIFLKPALSEAFHSRARLFPKATTFLVLGPAVNRGPPQASAFI